jgi:5-hydroxyisourate hydrolase / 2-oxo-4-hydroxy-4-carboxy-5-ureidoimidazoline decarboxylase
MILEDLNRDPYAQDMLFNCCSSWQWVKLMMTEWPFDSTKTLVRRATGIWHDDCSEHDWLESFTHHPKIGDVKSLNEKYASTAKLAGEEQASVNTATQDVIEQLATANAAYEKKFGFIFIVCATGKSAHEMLRLLQDRLKNSYEEELNIAMGEQHKITITRLKKLLDEENWLWMRVSQLTTHVLDTSIGRPGKDISIRLQAEREGKWATLAQGVTNDDGRIPDLLAPERILPASIYKLVFDTADYFQSQNVKGFYPAVEIQFSITDDRHYHVPLLINPFGYSTYRGS